MRVTLKERAIVSSLTLVTTLTGYFYAKSREKDAIPYMMVGGFLGALMGEAITYTFCNDEHDNIHRNSKKSKIK
jgi:membrane protein DedA with SNARE-associated domain